MRPGRSLSLEAITKSYQPGVNAVDGVDLAVEAGEFVSFLGPSGSGKTTMLMMIAGFERPTSGAISLAGRRLDAVQPYDRNIGMVFQNYALFPHMSAADNVAFPLRMRGLPPAARRAKAAEALAIVGLTDFGARSPSQLSGGQQQRVALARALVFQPDLVLLDEPLGALDKNLREQMQIEIKRIHRDLGVTMIYVTHDQAEAMAMSDRIAIFNRGRIEQIGAPSEVYFAPRTRFVASFVGDSNILEGRASREGVIEVSGFGPVATDRRDLPAGARVSVLLRPETLRLCPELAAISATSNFMTIEEVVNYGDSVLVVGRRESVAMRLRVSSLDMPKLARGERCFYQWAPDRAHVIEQPQPTGP
jgi:putative spermidine/putrescine transport system ATP-binding protein